MAKPRLAKVRALFYILRHFIKRGCAYFDTASLFLPIYGESKYLRILGHFTLDHYETTYFR